jgi:exodeoxyribonuclease VII large subunit
MRHRLDRARQDLDRYTMALHARGERAIAATRAQLLRLHERLSGLHPRARILRHRTVLGDLERRLAAATPMRRIGTLHQELARLVARRDTAIRARLERRRAELGRLGGQMHALSPLAVLERGYAMVQAGDEIVRDAGQVKKSDRLHVRLARGALDVIVDDVIGESGE